GSATLALAQHPAPRPGGRRERRDDDRGGSRGPRPRRMTKKADQVLADGPRAAAIAVGPEGGTDGEAVFTTGMTGYQEVLTDPSYCGQIVTMTAPQIGNTGITSEDEETRAPTVAGFVLRELSPIESNWRSQAPLHEYLRKHGIVAI